MKPVIAWCLIVAIALYLTSCDTTPVNATPPTALSAADRNEAIGLGNKIAALSPTIRADEAQQLSACAYLTVRRLAVEYQMVWPSGMQNYLIATGQRKRGYCFQWAEDIMTALAKLKLQTIELHWAEAFIGTSAEHNVVVVTGIGQPYSQGILLDGWRYAGKLYTSPILADMKHFEWRENKVKCAEVLAKALPPPPPPARKSTTR